MATRSNDESLPKLNGASPSTQSSDAATSSSSSESNPEDLSLNKVREILFGQHVEDLRYQITNLEKALNSKVEKFASDQGKLLDELGNSVKKQLEQITESIQEEKGDRIDRLEELDSSIVDVKSLVSTEILGLTTRQEKAEAELGSIISTQTDELSKKLRTMKEEMNSSLSRLEKQKASRNALAGVLQNIAKGLEGDDPA